MLYLSLKWLHFIGLISWMCGILYLYRLLVYQAERGSNPDISSLLTLMARRLYKYITTPAMIVTYCAGVGMLTLNPGIFRDAKWFHVKFLMLLGMSALTGYAGALVTKFEKRSGKLPTSKTLRFMNELPTILLLIIVALAVFRPF
jgi:putative membrane protein